MDCISIDAYMYLSPSEINNKDTLLFRKADTMKSPTSILPIQKLKVDTLLAGQSAVVVELKLYTE